MTPINKIGIFNMTLPGEGPAALPQVADMTNQTTADIDLTQAVETALISFISGAWIDNSANAQALTISVDGTGQTIIWPASKQGFIQLLAPNPPKFTLKQAAFGGPVKFLFVNFPVFPYII